MNLQEFPVLHMRGGVQFPFTENSMMIGREQTIKAIDKAVSEYGGRIVVVTQRFAETPEPKTLEEIYRTGVLCSIEKVLRMTDGTMRVQITAVDIAEIEDLVDRGESPSTTGSRRCRRSLTRRTKS
jgi:ATP-dependent Lon protease